jgi:hypothetical protein
VEAREWDLRREQRAAGLDVDGAHGRSEALEPREDLGGGTEGPAGRTDLAA